MKFLTYDGRLATALLKLFHFFIVSTQLVCAAVPAMLFQALVGWQSTHLALLLGVASLLPIGPAIFAALASMADYLAAGGYPGCPLPRFWSAWANGVRRLYWWWLLASALILMLAYDLSLFGLNISVVSVTILVSSLLIVFTLGISLNVLQGRKERNMTLLIAVMLDLLRRPHVAVGWLGAVIACGIAMALPVVGPNAAMVLPAVCAWTILILNGAYKPSPRKELS